MALLVVSFVAWRSGVMSSRIHNGGQCVPAMNRCRDPKVAHRVCGRLSWSDCQWSPSSKETQTLFSGAGEEQALRTWSCADCVDRARPSGKPLVIQLPALAAVSGADRYKV